jgi:hypothetical protein
VENFKATVEEVVPVLPAGVYPAMFAKIAEQSNDNGTFWMLTFVVENGDLGIEITATTSPRITPKTKMGKWLTALLGHSVEVGEEVNFNDLIGAPVQIVVSINEAGYSRIENVLPAASSVPARKAK